MLDIKFDVIMSIFDEPDSLIKRSVQSVLDNSCKPINFVIVDDNPVAMRDLQVILSEVTNPGDVSFHVITNDQNIGLGFSLNKAIDQTTSTFIARMDADDVIAKTKFEKQLKLFSACEQIDICFTGYRLIYDNKVIVPNLEENACFRKHFFTSKYNNFKHATYMCRADYLKKFKYKISHAPEDFEMYFRMVKAGVNVKVLLEPLYDHHIDAKSSYRPKVKNKSREMRTLTYLLSLMIRHRKEFKKWSGFYAYFLKKCTRILSIFLFRR